MKEQEVSPTNSAEFFAKKIVEVLNDRHAFTNKKEAEIKEALISVYREFAREHGFEVLNVEARGMREGLGALCNCPPEDYLVKGGDQPMLEIWIGFSWEDRYKRFSFKRVIIRVEDSHFKAGEELKRQISLVDGNIKILIEGAKQHREFLGHFRDQYMAAVRKFDPH
jgi:hypothetical protein